MIILFKHNNKSYCSIFILTWLKLHGTLLFLIIFNHFPFYVYSVRVLVTEPPVVRFAQQVTPLTLQLESPYLDHSAIPAGTFLFMTKNKKNYVQFTYIFNLIISL